MAADDLAHLSLILTTAGRPRMFRDALELYAEHAPGLTIVAGDFSDDDVQKHNAGVAARFPQTVRYRAFASGTPRREAVGQLLAACETEFVVRAADADFLIPEGLSESVALLRARRDYAAAHGLYYAVAPPTPEGRVDVTVWSGFTGRAYDAGDPVARLMALLYWYQSIAHAVVRLEDVRRVELPLAVESDAMTELFGAAVTVIAGKVARLRSAYALRNAATGEAPSPSGEFSDAIAAGGEYFLAEYVPVREALAALLRAACGDARDMGRLVDTAFATHVRKNWREGAVWSKLAQQGEIGNGDVAALCAAGIESEPTPVPMPYLATFIQPLAANGWPAFG
jgi:glycosyltransferase domain-containing protein